MAGKSKDKILEQLCPQIAQELLSFHITKQKVTDRVNKECINSFKEDPISYSSWNRALNGYPVWEGLVEKLSGLWKVTASHADKYFCEPGNDILIWMKDIAPANWWYQVLKPELPKSSFLAWFSGRKISAEKVEAINYSFESYWKLLSWSLSRTREYRRHRRLLGREHQDVALRDFLFRLIVEDGLPRSKAIGRASHQDLDFGFANSFLNIRSGVI